uniref:SWIM-type domain-containing protein n=1 Tax=Ditylenchus dipsaci TaxID=166011 RepID=A0A915EF69_9BILA
MMNLPRFILVVEQLVNNWSLDPQRKEPVRVSTIPRNPNSNSRKSSGKTSSCLPWLSVLHLSDWNRRRYVQTHAAANGD